MDENRRVRNEKLAQTVMKGLRSRNMEGYYAASREEALKTALQLIPEGSSIGWGGTVSVPEIGLLDAVRSGNYVLFDRAEAKTEDEVRDVYRKTFDADFFLASSNAITEDGILVNIDGNSNRVSSIAYGPKNVLMIVGMNKVCPDLDAALSRARNTAAVINAQRFDIDTPCVKSGVCKDCKSASTICCQFLVTRYSRHTGRIKVILVNDDLGF